MTPDEYGCADVRDALAAYVAGTLPTAQMRQVERHIEQCERCAGELKQWRLIGALARDYPEPAPMPPFAVAWEQLHAALGAQRADAQAAQTAQQRQQLYEVYLDDIVNVADNKTNDSAASDQRNQINHVTADRVAPMSARIPRRGTTMRNTTPVTPTAQHRRPFIALAATVVLVALAAALFATLSARSGGPGAEAKTTPTISHTSQATHIPTVASTSVPINSGTGLPEGLDIISLQMLSATDGWAVGATGMLPHSDPTVAGNPSAPVEGVLLRYTNGHWELATSVFSNIGLNGVTMLSDTEGWAVGSESSSGTSLQVVILHDHNGVWSRVPLNMGGVLYQVSMLSADEGWAVGKGDGKFGSLILHYSHGSWEPVPNTFSLAQSVSMVSATDGWLVDDLGSIGHYRGGSWSVWSQTQSVGFSAVQMLSATDGWAIGDDSASASNSNNPYNPYILRFDGSSWRQVSTPADLGQMQLNGLDMISPSQGWVVGDVVSYTTPNLTCAIVQYSNGQWTNSPVSSYQGQLNTISMVSTTEGWAAGYSPNSTGTPGEALFFHYHNGMWSVYSPQG